MPKNNSAVRVYGGNNVLAGHLSFSGFWKDLGNIISYKLMDETGETEVTFANGDSLTLDGNRKVRLEVLLAEVDKSKLDLIDTLRSLALQLYIDNGKVAGKNQYMFFKEVNLIPKLTLEVPGNPQQIMMVFSVNPQSDLVSITVSGTTYTGNNNYYVIFEPSSSVNGNPSSEAL